MNIEQKLLTPNIYSRPQTKLTKITKIVVHYVGNPGSSAIANRNYFENLKNTKSTKASAHYIIGLNGEILMCIPESEIAYTSNSANSYSIGIENCHPLADGKFTQSTYNSLIELCADICKRYNLNPINDLLRHYDITQKICPKWFVDNPSDWNKFKEDVKTLMNKNNTLNSTMQSNYKISESNLSNFVTQGVIASPDYWRTLNIQYLNDLFTNSKDMIHKNINNGITTFDKALEILISAKIINSPDYWKSQSKLIKYVDQLIINIANKCKIVLQKIVQCEAGNQDEKGKILIANVINNRVKSKNFPNTIYDVVFAPNQFSPITDGSYTKSVVTDSTKIAVDKVLNGTDYSQSALYFRTIKSCEGSWHEKALIKLFDYKDHRFYK